MLKDFPDDRMSVVQHQGQQDDVYGTGASLLHQFPSLLCLCSGVWHLQYALKGVQNKMTLIQKSRYLDNALTFKLMCTCHSKSHCLCQGSPCLFQCGWSLMAFQDFALKGLECCVSLTPLAKSHAQSVPIYHNLIFKKYIYFEEDNPLFKYDAKLKSLVTYQAIHPNINCIMNKTNQHLL